MELLYDYMGFDYDVEVVELNSETVFTVKTFKRAYVSESNKTVPTLNNLRKEEVYEKSYLYQRDICRQYTNCGCGCPFSEKNPEWKPFGPNEYLCGFKRFTEEELFESINKNIEFIERKLKEVHRTYEG